MRFGSCGPSEEAARSPQKCIDREGLGKTLNRDKAILIGECLTDRLHCTTGLTNLKVIEENEDGAKSEISIPREIVLKVSLPLLLPKERK